MATNFEGKWRMDNTQGADHFDVTYEFIDNDFTLTNNLTEFKVHGTFTFDDLFITLTSFSLGESWTQGYLISDGLSYIDMQGNITKHLSGRFFKID